MALRLWLFIIGALIVQELAASNAALLLALENHFNLWVVHAIFVAATALDIAIGYWAGKWVQKYFQGRPFATRAEGWARQAEDYAGETGQHLALLLLGLLNFVYIDAFVVSWLKMPFRDVFLFLFVGDLLWYAAEWLLVMGVHSLVPNPYWGVLAVIGFSFVVVLGLRIGQRHLLSDRL